MEILIVSDIHGNIDTLKEIILQESGVSAVVMCGDLTNFGPSELVGEIDGILENTGIPGLAIPGNCDPYDILGYLDTSENIVNLHRKCYEFGNITFCGLGGSNPTPFRTPFELSEEEISRIIREYSGGKRSVLVSHPPPRGVLDEVRGMNVGSTAVEDHFRKFPMVFCGHIHECRGIRVINGTTVVNPGPAMNGYYAVVDCKKKRVNLFRL